MSKFSQESQVFARVAKSYVKLGWDIPQTRWILPRPDVEMAIM